MEACPGPGSCQGLYTANTMACVTEALGRSLPRCAAALAVSSEKERIAYQSGQKVVEIVKKGITARTIMTQKAFENAIMVDMALGGSTNSCLHIPAIAKEAKAAVVSDEDVIRAKENAYHKEGGIAVLYGSLSPKGSVVKQSAVSVNMMKYKGVDKVFK